MVYLDTSVLVALILNEPKSADVAKWYGTCADKLVSAMWCNTEFASALGIMQRARQITEMEAQAARQRFERLCANDLELIAVDPSTFHRVAVLTLNASSGMRAAGGEASSGERRDLSSGSVIAAKTRSRK